MGLENTISIKGEITTNFEKKMEHLSKNCDIKSKSECQLQYFKNNPQHIRSYIESFIEVRSVKMFTMYEKIMMHLLNEGYCITAENNFLSKTSLITCEEIESTEIENTEMKNYILKEHEFIMDVYIRKAYQNTEVKETILKNFEKLANEVSSETVDISDNDQINTDVIKYELTVCFKHDRSEYYGFEF